MKSITLFTLVLFLTHISLYAQNSAIKAFDKVASEIKAASLSHASDYEEGRCDKVLKVFGENASFVSGGRQAPSRDFVRTICTEAKRPFEKTAIISEEVKVLSETCGYTIRTIKEQPDEGRPDMTPTSIITKLWQKIDNAWRIVHFHSSYQEVDLHNRDLPGK